MNDPREAFKLDPFDQLSSDNEEESTAIQKQLEFLEHQKKDLLNRLKENQNTKKVVDPNFQSSPYTKNETLDNILIKESPKKHIFNGGSSIREVRSLKKRNFDDNLQKSNYNDGDKSKVTKSLSKESAIPAGSTEYFMNNFASSKKAEQEKIQAHQDMMSSRVHAFGTADVKEYKAKTVNEQNKYSGIWTSTEYIPTSELDKILHNIKILRLPKLFSKVRPPKFEEPQYSNWVTVGILSKKSTIKYTSSNKPTKYFKFTLTDFQYNVDIMVFNKEAVERYYNLRIGDIIAILNPTVSPWRPSDNAIKSFNLQIRTKYECILEMGKSRDLGFCPVENKNGNICRAPINTLKEKCCDYHREIEFRSNAAKRIELNGAFALGAPTKPGKNPSLYRDQGRRSKFNVIRKQQTDKSEERFSTVNFRNQKIARAFYDQHYQNPDMITNLESKRRKIKDDKKERELKKALSKQSMNTNDLNDKELKNVRNLTNDIIHSSTMKNIGYDPTNGKINKLMTSSEKKGSNTERNSNISKKDTLIKEMLNFKKEKVNLKPSKVNQLLRKTKRNMVWRDYFGETNKEKEKSKLLELLDADSSDDELEIV